MSEDQPAFAGILIWQNLTVARNNPTSLLTSGSHNAQVNDLVLCDPTGGDVTVAFPPAFNAQGTPIIVKNQTASVAHKISVTPSGGDTIDGAASLDIQKARGSVMFVSDGVSDWVATGGYNFP